MLIHDAARPFTTPALIDRAIDAALARGAAVPGLPVTDGLIVDGDERVTGTPPRQTLLGADAATFPLRPDPSA